MSDRRDDGGPAFPVGVDAGSLRDWFAGQALAGLLAMPDVGEGVTTVDEAPNWAYRYADAMLAERAKGGGE